MLHHVSLGTANLERARAFYDPVMAALGLRRTLEVEEAVTDQNRSVELIRRLIAQGGDPALERWALEHRDIIERFGRFPHRNQLLGRPSTCEEQKFLAKAASRLDPLVVPSEA